MIVWMLYTVLIGLIVAAAARAAEWIGRLAGYHVRWIWAGALALTVFLGASAAVRGTETIPAQTTVSSSIGLGDAARMTADASWQHAMRVRIDQLRTALDAPLRDAGAMLHRTVSPAANMSVVLFASITSLGLGLLLIGVGRRFRKARREWPLVAMQGVDVRLAPRIGPVVIGLVRPEIVVPRWLLARCADEQHLVVTHEDEHIRAHDPLLLGFAWAAVVAAPWNPATWYMLSRLRLAVELDCDARVLRRGAAPRSYGSLLIDVAQHASSLRLSALALADDSSHLHQRILAMKPSVPRFARLRGGVAAVFSLAGVLVACQATFPSDADIERMDVATATQTARELAKMKHADTAVVYSVDGAKATVAEALSLAPSEIGRVQVVTQAPGMPTQINIETRRIHASVPARDSVKVATATVASDSGGVRIRALMKDGTSGPVRTENGLAPLALKTKGSFTGLIFIDGVRATMDQVQSLDRTRIESVEVLKGAAAARAFNDPAAANGVITVTTKSGSGKR